MSGVVISYGYVVIHINYFVICIDDHDHDNGGDDDNDDNVDKDDCDDGCVGNSVDTVLLSSSHNGILINNNINNKDTDTDVMKEKC